MDLMTQLERLKPQITKMVRNRWYSGEDLYQDVWQRCRKWGAEFWTVDRGALILAMARNRRFDQKKAEQRSALRLNRFYDERKSERSGRLDDSGPTYSLLQGEAARVVHEAVEALPPHYRDVVRSELSMTGPDVGNAARLGLPIETFRTKKKRASRILAGNQQLKELL